MSKGQETREGKAMPVTQRPFSWDGREGRETICEMVDLLSAFVQRTEHANPEVNALCADAKAVVKAAWEIGI